MLCLRNVPRSWIACAGYVAKHGFELRLGDLWGIPRQVHEQPFAYDKRAVLHRTPSIFNVPVLMKLFSRQMLISIAAMAVIQRLRRIAMYPAVVGERQVALDVPVGPGRVIGKHVEHAKDGSQSSLGVIEPVTLFIEHVADNVAALQTRRKFVRSTEAGDGRELMLQVGLASNRAVDERQDFEPSAGVAPGLAGNKWDIRVQVKRRHAIHCKRTLVPDEKTPALAGAEQEA
jgi:hypothetical protein